MVMKTYPMKIQIAHHWLLIPRPFKVENCYWYTVIARDPDDEEDRVPRTVVVVEVQDNKNNATHLWSLEKLR